MYVCMYVCMYIYIYIYTHTHMKHMTYDTIYICIHVYTHTHYCRLIYIYIEREREREKQRERYMCIGKPAAWVAASSTRASRPPRPSASASFCIFQSLFVCLCVCLYMCLFILRFLMCVFVKCVFLCLPPAPQLLTVFPSGGERWREGIPPRKVKNPLESNPPISRFLLCASTLSIPYYRKRL